MCLGRLAQVNVPDGTMHGDTGDKDRAPFACRRLPDHHHAGSMAPL